MIYINFNFDFLDLHNVFSENYLANELTRSIVFEVIYEQRERVFHRDIQSPNTRKQCMKTRARSASVFIHCFRVLGYPGETRARVVYMASQMNRDVTECFRLLEFLTKHNVISNSIQVILHA